jgi:hypothetical protein
MIMNLDDESHFARHNGIEVNKLSETGALDSD